MMKRVTGGDVQLHIVNGKRIQMINDSEWRRDKDDDEPI